MTKFTVIIPIVIYCFSFIEFFVFNDEMLLALCFISFVVFMHTLLGNSASNFFADRAKGFEQNIFLTLADKYNSLSSRISSLSLIKLVWPSLLVVEVLYELYWTRALNRVYQQYVNRTYELLEELVVEYHNSETLMTMNNKKNLFHGTLFSLIYAMVPGRKKISKGKSK